MRKLIAGPAVFICDECIDLTYGMIHDVKPAEGQSLAVDLAERRKAKLLAKKPGATPPPA